MLEEETLVTPGRSRQWGSQIDLSNEHSIRVIGRVLWVVACTHVEELDLLTVGRLVVCVRQVAEEVGA